MIRVTSKAAPARPASVGAVKANRPSAITYATAAGAPAPFAQLSAVAQRSVTANIHQLGAHSYVSAGARQFKGLWTRDFAWSVRGLLAMGRADVVKAQLELILGQLRPGDHLLPRSLDSTDTKLRVAMATAHQMLPLLPASLRLTEKLKPEYIDQHGQLAFDGNLMVVLAARQYVDATHDTAFWDEHKAQLGQALQFYDAHTVDGLLQQPPFSDWQDSVKREGHSFYSNMLYARVLELVSGDPAFPGAKAKATALRSRIEQTFKDPQTGLYRAMATGPQTSLDGNLLALDLGYLAPDSAAGRALFAALKNSPLWTAAQGPGFSTWPPYPNDQKAGLVKFVGLGGYHDSLYWSWQMALAAKVAGRMGDVADARAIAGRLDAMARRDGAIGEVYVPADGLPAKQTPLYRSEQPFTWGAAFVVDALKSLEPTLSEGR